MKQNTLVILFTLAVSMPVARAATTYSTGFENPPFNDPIGDLAGTDGWVIDDGATPGAGASGVSFIVADWDRDGPGPLPGSQAGAIGGFYNSPGVVANVTHAVIIPLTSLLFDVDFAVVPSTVDFPGEDSFSWTFLGTSNPADTPLLRIAFEPPGGNGDLEIAWYDNLGNRNLLSPSQDIFYDGTYHLNVGVTGSGADAAFTATLTGTNAFTFGGTLIGQAGATVVGVGARVDVTPLTGDGDNYMKFDNFSAVPEPQSALLFGLAFLVAAARRSRRT